MTRINVIEPALLSDKHLGAEYRELPRIFGLVKRAIGRGVVAVEARSIAPTEYTLGRGHCLFFYTRLAWLQHRYGLLVAECAKRGRVVNHPVLPTSGISGAWFDWWEVTERARRMNLARIAERGGLRVAVTRGV